MAEMKQAMRKQFTPSNQRPRVYSNFLQLQLNDMTLDQYTNKLYYLTNTPTILGMKTFWSPCIRWVETPFKSCPYKHQMTHLVQ